MSIKTIWDNNERTAIRFIYDGPWTWSEFSSTIAESHVMMDTVGHKVNVIIDITNSQLMPNGLISRISSLRSKIHPNTGLTILVGANSFVQRLYDMFAKVYKDDSVRNFIIVGTLAEAYSIINAAKRSEGLPLS